MFTSEIENLLTNSLSTTKTEFLGVFARDQLPSPTHFPCCFVANTDVEGQPGTHWVAFYVEAPTHMEFFDSYGHHPTFYDFDTSALIHFNTQQFQAINSAVCGHYCIYFLHLRSRRMTLGAIVKQLADCGTCTDHCVTMFVKHLAHGVRAPPHCTGQCCKPRGRE